MGPRRKHRHRLEALESRLFLSARGDDAPGNGSDVDNDNGAPFEMAAQDHGHAADSADKGIQGAKKDDSRNSRPSSEPISAPKSLAAALFAHSGRDGDKSSSGGNGKGNEHKDPPGRALGHEKHAGGGISNENDSHGQVNIGSSGDGRGSRPVDPFTETPGASGGDEDPPAPGYQPKQDRESNSNTETATVPLVYYIGDLYKSTGGPGSPLQSKTVEPPSRSAGPANISPPAQRTVESDQTGQAEQVENVAGLSGSRQTLPEIVVPEDIEPAATNEEANTTTAPETETPNEEVGSQPTAPAGDTVSAQPLGAAGSPVEKLPEEIQGDGSLPIKPVAEGEAIDVTSAAVAAFWAAVEILPVMPIAASQAGFNEELAEAVRVNFESFTEAVDTLLDTLAAQFDLSGPGRTRDLIFASSAALLAALACEKVRRRQQRLDDENLASLGFDADGYLLLAEGL